ncbi:UNVERIFIED_CONTAM: hypothetical protein BEN50_20555 [Euhalothece sp. KZN 001]
MDKRERACKYAQALETYRDLPQKKQEELAPIIIKGAKTYLAILEQVECGATYHKIASDLNLHVNTVKQIIYGFEDAGLVTEISKEKAQFRPRIKKKRYI